MSDPSNKQQSSKESSKLQDGNRLIVDAIVSLTDIVESMHRRITPLPNLAQTPQGERTKGISSLVYRSVRSITSLIGKNMDVPLGHISDLLRKKGKSSDSKALISALNGILGDHLVERDSSLAIQMQLMHQGKPLDADTFKSALEYSNKKVVIMVHGLCMNDEQWLRNGHDHGKSLEDDLHYTAIYLHYNSGLHVSQNGQAFSRLLENLESLSRTVNNDKALEISIIAHSMGGLVSRSAFHDGGDAKMQWPQYVKSIVFLGTPHHGAPLEKLGNWLDLLLGVHSYTAPLKGLLQIRSAGITDLRHGNVLESDWQARGRFDFSRSKRTPVALPESVNCFAVASTVSTNPSNLNKQLIGDGLVPIDSALGKHRHKAFTLDFPASHQWIGREINHMQLLSSPDVYMVIREWLASAQVRKD